MFKRLTTSVKSKKHQSKWMSSKANNKVSKQHKDTNAELFAAGKVDF